MKKDTIHDDIINLNGEIAQRKRAEQRLKDAKKGRGKENLTDAEDETLDELKGVSLDIENYCTLRGTVANSRW
ncbi:hypothetical protein [Escherichia coli]|uniref:hypothetical protein n=1 Tax=Escherichia coli TaxID=562 RepID=UPI00399B2696